jgi:hypothetical protein
VLDTGFPESPCHSALDAESPEKRRTFNQGIAGQAHSRQVSEQEPHFHLILFNKTTSVAMEMNNEVNEVGEYLLHHLLLRLFCWKKLGENEVFTAISLTAMRSSPQ